MSDRRLELDDYPLAETRPDEVRGARGLSLNDITLDAVMAGNVTMEDLRITANALQQQAEIAQAAGRASLAANFLRAAELTAVPQDVIMATYELLRPGRAADKQVMLDAAQRLRHEFAAERMAQFVEEAADVYGRRGLFKFRY
jgi:propanediol dehydratase small subunit